MHKYFIKTPWIAKKFFSSYVWSLSPDDNTVYLTFDDGPHPVVTPWVLDQLRKYDAKATFFCIGNNVEKYPDIFRQVLDEGHKIGNHTYHHLNGWKTDDKKYLDDVSKASSLIKTNLFRPPYGRIKNSQAKKIPDAMQASGAKIVMWDVLSADFDDSISTEQCLNNVLQNACSGSIIVFHDSQKAFTNLEHTLPKTLTSLIAGGFHLKSIDL